MVYKAVELLSNFSPFEREQCLRIIDKLITKDYCREFVKLDLGGNGSWVKEYRRRIAKPLDLQMVRANQQANAYLSLNDFAMSVDIVWTNSMEFNGQESYYAALAREAQAKCQRSILKVCKTREELWTRKLIKTGRMLKEAAARLAKQTARDARRDAERPGAED
jgi:hypothetical protein